MNQDQSLAVGFIGLGVMGVPMATHLGRAGHRLQVFDLDPAARERMHQAWPQASVRADAADAARGADIVFTMLPNGQVVNQVVCGERGVVQGMAAGALLVDTSSSEPWLTEQTAAALAQRGAAMIDAPVSGAQWGAQAAELVFMVGGAPPDVARARPLLDAMGRQVFHLGPLASGHMMKCLNNLITAMTLAATSEGLAIGTRCGLDPAVMVDVLNESTGGSWISRTHFHQRIFNRTFDDPFQLALMRKDVGIALELARRAGLDAPLSQAGQSLWNAAADGAAPGASISEFVRWVEQRSGVELRRRA